MSVKSFAPETERLPLQTLVDQARKVWRRHRRDHLARRDYAAERRPYVKPGLRPNPDWQKTWPGQRKGA